MSKSTLHGIVLVAVSACLTVLVMELAVRIRGGTVLRFESLTAEPVQRVGRMAYHPGLGWSPRPGRFGGDWTANVDAAGLRSNGRSIATTGRPILAVGDSFTFGDEVDDGETWAARLEETLNKPVLNAGVGAYGIDQAVLRAELLLAQYHPDVVILSFISDDINRTEFSYYPFGRGWKPYFEYANGSLLLRNVPVPEKLAPRDFQSLRIALGYSHLADAVLRRAAPLWWRNLPVFERVHDDGENVSVELLVRLDGLTRKQGGQFIAIAMGTNGLIGDNARLPNVMKRAREKGLQVLDLSTETRNLRADELQGLFRPGGHYSPAMNSRIAERIASFLLERRIVNRSAN